jgi:hypothetical protein
VVYDESNSIIGGGFTYVNFIPANASTGVNMTVVASGKVANVELYPMVSELSQFASKKKIPEDATEIILLKQGFGKAEYQSSYGFTVENPNSDYSVEDSKYRVTFLSGEGTVVDTDEGYINILLPNQTLGIAGFAPGDDFDKAEVQIMTGNYQQTTEELPQFTSEKVVFGEGPLGGKVTGFILNPYTKDITDLWVSAIAYDSDGEIIGGGFTFLDFAAANGKSAVEINISTSTTPASVELYAMPTSLSEFE